MDTDARISPNTWSEPKNHLGSAQAAPLQGVQTPPSPSRALLAALVPEQLQREPPPVLLHPPPGVGGDGLQNRLRHGAHLRVSRTISSSFAPAAPESMSSSARFTPAATVSAFPPM